MMNRIIILLISLILILFLLCSCNQDVSNNFDSSELFEIAEQNESDFNVTLAKNAIWRFYMSRGISVSVDNIVYSGFENNAHRFDIEKSIEEDNTDKVIPYSGAFYVKLARDDKGEFYAVYGEDDNFIFHYELE